MLDFDPVAFGVLRATAQGRSAAGAPSVTARWLRSLSAHGYIRSRRDGTAMEVTVPGMQLLWLWAHDPHAHPPADKPPLRQPK
ncbi:hypothetical protein [Actinokineospora iranica]|uniref:Uncharacterized protein n=1 Tax=Actinokineospora iranica TaxID=1271860 RepID=A0A1G6WMN4_9PSEU|nr:hypothetical protein [Actinokineospora iranica]SDD67108.1 hypothetical protein SAMN05216174_11587 [Actinokineospora iranica]